MPNFSHVYVLMLENHEYQKIVSSPDAPYMNGLIAQYGLATNYLSIAHPSQPNYLAIFSGSTQGVTDDSPHTIMASNLADQLESAGKTWKLFEQNIPTTCFKGSSASGGEDGTGKYARKHNPAISFTDINSSSARCANITDFTHFDPAVASFELIAPNTCNIMHDCGVATGDQFLSGFVPQILNSPAWQQNGVLFVTFDEGSSDSGGGGHVPLLVISKQVPAGFKSSLPHNHYSLLRTIEDAWGLPCLENACTADALSEFFK